MKTMVAIRADTRDYRFVTRETVGNVLRRVVEIVTPVHLRPYADDIVDPALRIAENIFTAFPHYPVKTNYLYSNEVADWHVIVDCDDCRIYVGRNDTDDRDGWLLFGAKSEKINWYGVY